MRQEVEGTLRVAAIYSVGLSEMVDLEQEFARRQPEAKLEILPSVDHFYWGAEPELSIKIESFLRLNFLGEFAQGVSDKTGERPH